MRKPILILLTCIAIANILKSQDNLPPLKFYQFAEIGLRNFSTIKAEKLSILEDTVSYFTNEIQHTNSFGDLRYIKVKEGTKAGKGALLGGILMLTASTSAALGPNESSKNSALQTITISTISGALLGALIGGFTARKVSYYIHATPY